MPSGAQSPPAGSGRYKEMGLELWDPGYSSLEQEHTGVADLLMGQGRPSITLLLQELK